MRYITILDSNYFLLQSAQKSFLLFLSIRPRGSCVRHMPVYTFKREPLKGNYKVSDHEGRHRWEKDWLMQHELRAVNRKAKAVHRRERCCPICLHLLPVLANQVTRSQRFWKRPAMGAQVESEQLWNHLLTSPFANVWYHHFPPLPWAYAFKALWARIVSNNTYGTMPKAGSPGADFALPASMLYIIQNKYINKKSPLEFKKEVDSG